MRPNLFPTLTLLACASLSHAQQPTRALDQDLYALPHQNFTRTYGVHAGKPAKPDAKLPLILVLHGGGGTGAAAMLQGHWNRLADDEHLIAVFPNALPVDPNQPQSFKTNPQVWNDGSNRGTFFRKPDDVAFIAAVLDDVARHYPVDEDRVYVTGFSNGASMTFRLAAELSDRFAAAAPVSGHLFVKDAKPTRPVPALFLVGAEDPLNPLNGGPATNPWNPKGETKAPMQETVDDYLKMIGLAGAQPDPLGDRPPIHAVRYGTPGALEFLYYRIDALGHTWPGGADRLPPSLVGKRSNAINATDVIWFFFQKHTRHANAATTTQPTTAPATNGS